MKPSPRTLPLVVLSLLIPFGAGPTASNKTKPKLLPRNQIVVSARRFNTSIEYAVGKTRYSKRDLAEWIGEARLSSSPDSDFVIVLEDTLSLSDIKEVPQMALDAGFKNVRLFLYWKGTGNMAELFFGPVVKHNLNHFPE
jgi:hypothetical protein